ncbi:MAG: L-threonylcarbamoyladenylate synthase [Actinomycetaceae bacterium]|nr:L-threonylcarbamoyladenylate synthase [Actinomycetaceae bacterium]
MTQYLEVHPENPQPRQIAKAIATVRGGGVIAYPTDSGYAIGCALGNKQGIELISKIRKLPPRHDYTLVCHDFAQLGQMTIVDNTNFRLIKSLTPGPYTFILKGTKEVPRIMLNPKKHTIGARIPDHRIALALLEELGEPLMSSTLIMPGREDPEQNAWEIRDEIGYLIDVIVDGPVGESGPTTVVDLTEGYPQVKREGAGDISVFQ